MSLIEVKELSKHFKVLSRREGLTGAMRGLFSADYRIVKAVDDISFAIQPGEIVGYIGPNGAGKSMTIKMMTGILSRLLVANNVPYENRKKNAQITGVIFAPAYSVWHKGVNSYSGTGS